jgi:hypothetical protein
MTNRLTKIAALSTLVFSIFSMGAGLVSNEGPKFSLKDYQVEEGFEPANPDLQSGVASSRVCNANTRQFILL